MSFKFDSSMLDMAGIKSNWYADMSPLHTNSYSNFVVSLFLIIHIISSRGIGITSTSIFPNIILLRYFIPSPLSYSNIFVQHHLNHVSLEFTNPSGDTYLSRIIIVNNIRFQMMGYPSKVQQLISVLFHMIQ